LDSKSEKCIFIGYKDGLKGYKLWNPVTRKVVYSRDVVFREVKDVIQHEVQPKEPEKIEFEPKEEESDSVAEEESEDEEPQTLAVRRSVRERRQLERYNPSAFSSNFALSVTDDDPRTVKEAVDSKDGKLWKEAMVDEMASLHKNEAWDLVEFPAGRKPIGSKWVFKKKTNAEGKVEKYKARLVAKGYSQVPGIDFGDIFSPIAKVNSIRLILFVVAAFDFEVEQMDVKIVFLHGDLEEEIYMKKPKGFAVKGKKELICKLKKSLYGLKQSPRMWYQKFDTFIQGLGFTRSKADHCVYFKLIGDRVIYLVLYVDDMFWLYLLRSYTKVLFATSIFSSICGWNVLDLLNFVSMFSHNLVQNLLRNLMSLSEMMLLGIPKCTQTCAKNTFTTSCLLMVFLQGIRIHILLNLSTTTNR